VQEFVQEWRPFCFPNTDLLKSQIRVIYLGNGIELMCSEKQRNRENRNFKSVASAISPQAAKINFAMGRRFEVGKES
jgi:hypothetical protein